MPCEVEHLNDGWLMYLSDPSSASCIENEYEIRGDERLVLVALSSKCKFLMRNYVP